MQIFLYGDLSFLTATREKFKKKSPKNFLCGPVEHRFDNSAEKSFLTIRKNIETYKLSQVILFPKNLSRSVKRSFENDAELFLPTLRKNENLISSKFPQKFLWTRRMQFWEKQSGNLRSTSKEISLEVWRLSQDKPQKFTHEISF